MKRAHLSFDLFERYWPWWLAATLAAALALRLWGIDFGLPYLYHPDEPGYVAIAQRIFTTGDLNPHFFNYPSLFFYLNALAYAPYYLLGRLTGRFDSVADIAGPTMLIGGSGVTTQPGTFLLGRGLSVLFAVASVCLVFVIGRRLTGRALPGLLAALLLALSATHVANSRYIAPDVFLVFFLLLAFWGALQVYDHGRLRDYALAGAAVGLVAATKYNGAIMLVVVVIAHTLRTGWRGFFDRRLFTAIGVSALAFLAGTPFALFDAESFLAGVRIEAQHYSTGHVGSEGNALAWYASFLWTSEGVTVVLALLALAYAVVTRDRRLLLLAAFPVIYFGFISTFVVRNDRTAMPLLPFLYLLAVLLLARLRWSADTPAARRTLGVAGSVVLLVAMLAWPAVRTVAETQRLTTVNSLETARVWLDQNLAPGTRVAVESYAPYVDPQRFVVQGFYKLIDNSPEWYIDHGYSTLVFSQRMFRRFYDEPDKYAAEIALYEALFQRCQPLRVFTDGGYEVRVCQLRSP